MKTKNVMLTAALTFAVFAANANETLCIEGRRWEADAKFLGVNGGKPTIVTGKDAAPSVVINVEENLDISQIPGGISERLVTLNIGDMGYLAYNAGNGLYFTKEKNDDSTWGEQYQATGYASRFFVHKNNKASGCSVTKRIYLLDLLKKQQ